MANFLQELMKTKSKEAQSILDDLDLAYKSRLNDLGNSIKITEQALEQSKELGDKSLIAKSLSLLALFYMITGEGEESMDLSLQAIDYFEELKDERGIADTKYNIAGLHYKTDNFHAGLIYLIDCLNIYRKFEDHHNQARVLKSIGTIYEFFGDRRSAIEHYEKSVQEARISGDINIESNAYNPLSGIYLNQGKIKQSMEMIEKSIQMKQESGDTRGLAFALYGRGKIYTKTKEFEKAEIDLKESIDIHVRMGEKIGLGMSYHKLGFLYMEMGLNDLAKQTLIRSIEFSKDHNLAMVKYKSNYLLYLIFKDEGDINKALQYHERYIKEKDVVINTQTFKLIDSYEALMKMQAVERETQIKREKAEILRKKKMAEQASKMKEDFLSTMSHEIRTPLNAVITITSLLKERSKKDEKQLLDSLKFSANNLMLIINDILDFTKLDAGKVKLELHPTRLNVLVEKITNTYSSMAQEKGLKLSAEIDEWLSEAYLMDEIKISQMLANLISNAIKFTEKGSIEVRISKVAEEKRVDTIRFKVSDTGMGIPKEDREVIWESFTQPKQLTTRTEGGSGLGLSIVKKLLKLHKSDISLKSEPGKGSEFWFDLMLEKAAAEPKPSEEHTDQLKGLKVLIADDMMVNAMVAGKLLSTWGMEIDHANDGFEAITMSEKTRFDFILMDIHMPELDGFEATKRIRESADNPNQETPIFALTADVTAEQQEIYSPYFNEFMLKPIDRDKLLQAFLEFTIPNESTLN